MVQPWCGKAIFYWGLPVNGYFMKAPKSSSLRCSSVFLAVFNSYRTHRIVRHHDYVTFKVTTLLVLIFFIIYSFLLACFKILVGWVATVGLVNFSSCGCKRLFFGVVHWLLSSIFFSLLTFDCTMFFSPPTSVVHCNTGLEWFFTSLDCLLAVCQDRIFKGGFWARWVFSSERVPR